MSAFTQRTLAAASILAIAACGSTKEPENIIPESNVPGSTLFIEAPDGEYHGPMQSIRVDPAEITLEVALEGSFKAFGTFEDGTEVEVTEFVSFSNGQDGVFQRAEALTDGALMITGMAAGETQLILSLGDLTTEAKVTIVPSALTSIELIASATEVRRGETFDLSVMGTYRDGTTADVTGQATFTLSDPALGTINGSQLSTVEIGLTDVTATVEELTATTSLTSLCSYPLQPNATFQNDRVVPNMYWENAQNADGSTFRFDLEDVFCNQPEIKSMAFLISTEWCPYCPDRMRWLTSMASQLEAAGMMTVIVEAQNRSGGAIGTEAGARHINSIIGQATAVRLGDADARPTSNIFNNSPVVTAFPTVFVVRTRDMKIIADQSNSRILLPMVDIAQNPNWDWSDPEDPQPAFVNLCAEGADEDLEPNDTPPEAPVIGAMTIEGGICTDAPDYYYVNIAGEWSATLTFEHDVGDLDIVVWNEAADRPFTRDGEPLGGVTETDNETFRHAGPNVIRIYGKRQASAPYQLVIEEL